MNRAPELLCLCTSNIKAALQGTATATPLHGDCISAAPVEVTDDAEGDGGATEDDEALSGLATATGALTVLAAGIGGALGCGGGSTATCRQSKYF